MKSKIIVLVLAAVFLYGKFNSIYATEATDSSVEEEFDATAIQDGEYNTSGKATIEEGHGYVTFKGHVNDNISENIYIEFWNLENYDVYKYYVYEANDYTTSIELPPGVYMIMDGGMFYDTKGEYPIENVQFEVKANTASVVDFGVGLDKNRSGKYVQDEEYIELTIENEDGSSDVYAIDGQTHKEHIDAENNVTQVNQIKSVSQNGDDVIVTRSTSIKSLIVTFLTIAVIGLVGIIIYIKKRG